MPIFKSKKNAEAKTAKVAKAAKSENSQGNDKKATKVAKAARLAEENSQVVDSGVGNKKVAQQSKGNDKKQAFSLPALPAYDKITNKKEVNMEDAIAAWPGLQEAFDSEGLVIWRIRDDHTPTLLAKNEKGTFKVSECYLLLECHRKNSERIIRNIHYWLGSEACTMKMGALAILTVELDRLVKAEHVWRECQNDESILFLDYFTSTGRQYGELAYVSGSQASKSVERTSRAKLFQLRGESPSVRFQEVPCELGSLRNDASFLLDDGWVGTADRLSIIHLWHGSQVAKHKQIGYSQFAEVVRTEEKGGRARMVHIRDDPTNAVFWNALSATGEVADMTTLPKAQDEDEQDNQVAADTHVFSIIANPAFLKSKSKAKCSLPPLIVTRQVDIFQEGYCPLIKKEVLGATDVIIVDCCGTQLYVWIGQKADIYARKVAMLIAEHYCAFVAKRPASTPITRIVQKSEVPSFKVLTVERSSYDCIYTIAVFYDYELQRRFYMFDGQSRQPRMSRMVRKFTGRQSCAPCSILAESKNAGVFNKYAAIITMAQ